MTTIGFVGGRAVGRDVLDRRIAALREGPTASSLPRPGSAEDRQLARWLTQVILTETLCEDEAARLGLTPVDGPPLDPVAAVELGSVNTAAYRGSPWVRAVYRQVTATAEVPASWRSSPVREDRRARHQVRYGLFEHPEDARTATPADLEPLGAVLAAGYLVYRATWIVRRFAGRLPRAMQAEPSYLAIVGALDRLARWLTGRLQVGSLPVYLGVIVVTVSVVPTLGLLGGLGGPTELRFADSWVQPVLVVVLLVAAGAVVLARRRLTAVLLTGLVGYSIGALFVVEGGVDLALAQFLVESLTLVVFVFVLRRFPSSFGKDRPRPGRVRWIKGAVAALGGTVVAVLAVLVSGSRSGLPQTSHEYIARAEPEAGATNVVNSIIVDFRAFDTLGEVTVLAVAAIGAASLILAAHRQPRRQLDGLDGLDGLDELEDDLPNRVETGEHEGTRS